MIKNSSIRVCGTVDPSAEAWQTPRVPASPQHRQWWRWPWLDELRRRMSYLIFVQKPQDLVPVVPQSELVPALEDRHIEILVQVCGEALKSNVDEVAPSKDFHYYRVAVDKALLEQGLYLTNDAKDHLAALERTIGQLSSMELALQCDDPLPSVVD